MLCPKCGTTNSEGFKFCIKCGNALETIETENITPVVTEEVVVDQTVQPQQQSFNTYQQQPTQPQQPIQTSNASTIPNDNSPLNYLKYILGLLLKPFETYKSEEGKLSNAKNSLILSGIVAGAMMLINLLTAMISSVFVKTMDYSTFKYKTEFNIEGLKNLDYLDLIGKNLLIYVCIIAAIAVVYYLASLVAKKSISFIKALSIIATAMIPYVVLGMIASPLLGKIWSSLAVILTVVAIVYSIIIFVTLINTEIKFDNKDHTIYFNLICMTVLICAGGYAIMELSGMNSLLGLF